MRIEVIDHDDTTPRFEQPAYEKTLVESTSVYESFMTVRARDSDCTNEGYACSYKLLTSDLVPVDDDEDDAPLFRVDKLGRLSSTRALVGAERFEYRVRAFDCLNNQSFVDAELVINVVEKCVPQWTSKGFANIQKYSNNFLNLSKTNHKRLPSGDLVYSRKYERIRHDQSESMRRPSSSLCGQ